MDDQTFKVIELAGASPDSIEDAINQAIQRASRSLHGLSWFQVGDVRGRIVDGRIAQYQVMLKVGFALDER